MIARPLLALTQGADPLLAVAPAIIERALVHNISGASSGSLQNEFWTSREMRRYSSHAGGVEGVAFNEEVAAGLRALGLKAWDSAKPSWCLDLKKTPEVVQLGDVDALAVSREGKHVWVVEAKDLKLCRTLGEVSRRLSEYRGLSDQKGRPDSLLKHLRRVEFLRRHADRLVGRLGLPEAPQVHGIIVVRSPQPMAQLRGEYSADALVVMLQDLASVPWNDGWAQE